MAGGGIRHLQKHSHMLAISRLRKKNEDPYCSILTENVTVIYTVTVS